LRLYLTNSTNRESELKEYAIKKIDVKNENTKIKLKNNNHINKACTNPG
jgi:hypothetical protein